jgi:hypothetical protein
MGKGCLHLDFFRFFFSSIIFSCPYTTRRNCLLIDRVFGQCEKEGHGRFRTFTGGCEPTTLKAMRARMGVVMSVTFADRGFIVYLFLFLLSILLSYVFCLEANSHVCEKNMHAHTHVGLRSNRIALLIVFAIITMIIMLACPLLTRVTADRDIHTERGQKESVGVNHG